MKHKVITVLRDNSGENRIRELEDFLCEEGIESRYSALYENGKMDRLGQHSEPLP